MSFIPALQAGAAEICFANKTTTKRQLGVQIQLENLFVQPLFTPQCVTWSALIVRRK
jgi:hypothetical protein